MKSFLVIAVAALAVTGCAHHYKMTLTNGNSITTSGKPKLNKAGTAYRYKDLQGKESWISAGRVTEIEAQ